MKRSGFRRAEYTKPHRPPLQLGQPKASSTMSRSSDKVVTVPKTEYVRSESYRRYVAKMNCVNCGIADYSQAAHPNSLAAGGSAGGKASDVLCFPLCSVAGNDCHRKFDHYELCSKENMVWLEDEWSGSTQYDLILMSQEIGKEAQRLRATLIAVGLVK